MNWQLEDKEEATFSEQWTRLYMKNNSGAYDFDGDHTMYVVNAMLNNEKLISLVDKYGEAHHIRVSEIEAVALKTKQGLEKGWLETVAWEKHKKSIIGWDE